MEVWVGSKKRGEKYGSLLPSTRPKPLAFFRSAAITVHSLTNGTTGTGSVITGCRITREKLEEKKINVICAIFTRVQISFPFLRTGLLTVLSINRTDKL